MSMASAELTVAQGDPPARTFGSAKGRSVRANVTDGGDGIRDENDNLEEVGPEGAGVVFDDKGSDCAGSTVPAPTRYRRWGSRKAGSLH